MKTRPRIVISGETAGTGASTTAKLLSEHLQLPTISGGKYFRALANRFNHFSLENPQKPLEAQYQLFLNIYKKTFDLEGLKGVTKLMREGIKEGATGDILETFDILIENNLKRTGRIDGIWDYIVDQKTISEALSEPGFIWESKLAVVSLELDQLQPVVNKSNALEAPHLRVLLSLDPSVAAQRVGQRENRMVGTEEILMRKQRDFDRYGTLYQIKNRRLAHDDLLAFADIVLNTEETSPHDVVIQVLDAYLQKVMNSGSNTDVSVKQIADDLEAALAELR